MTGKENRVYWRAIPPATLQGSLGLQCSTYLLRMEGTGLYGQPRVGRETSSNSQATCQ